jgi:hypothetical protein|nr:MAG TPA_asm: hypothetical protein [Caudoviricetes sp.]
MKLTAIFVAASVLAGSSGYVNRMMPEPVARKIFRNGIFYVEIVRFNASHAVACKLRPHGWNDIVVGTAKTQVAADRQWFLARGALAPTVLDGITKKARSDVAKLYAMPCQDLARLPMLAAYDAAVYRRAPLPMPDLTR